MNIIPAILLTVFIAAYLGWGLVGLVRRGRTDLSSCLMVPFGYALGQALFFPAYFLLADAKRAVISVLAFATLPNLIYGYHCFARHKDDLKILSASRKRQWLPYLAGATAIIVAALPYAHSGFGDYWHSANEDIIDGLNGRDAYLSGDLVAKNQGPNADARLRGSLITQQLVKSGIHKTSGREAGFFRARYVHDLGRLQYSSLAFWSVILGTPHGMDAFLVQALLNLGLFAMGVFVFAQRIFLQPGKVAFTAAIIAAAGNFYLATYLNGHEGSLMYNAVAPFLLYCLVHLIEKKQRPGIWLVIPGVFLVFILGVYPYPLPFVVLPVLAYAAMVWLAGRRANGEVTYDSLVHVCNRPLLKASALLVLVGGYAGAWVLLAPIRLRAVSQFRSWGTMLDYAGFLQYWGLWPSTGNQLGWLNSQLGLKVAALFLALALAAVAIVGFRQLYKHRISFLLVWLPAWGAFFFLMRFCVYDSYYLYKFLYINAWLTVIPAVVGSFWLVNSTRQYCKYGGIIVLIAWLGANSINDAMAFFEIAKKGYNADFSSYEKLGLIPKEMLVGTFIDTPFYDQGDVIKQVLIANSVVPQGSKEEATYLLTIDGIGDVLPETKTATVWHSGGFTLKKAPEADVLEIATYFNPEVESDLAPPEGNQPFRWIPDAKNGYAALNIYRRTSEANYLYLCAESGPSVDYGMVDVTVTDAAGRAVGQIGVGSYDCKWVNIEQYRAPFTLSHTAQGKLISAIEQRKLIYRIFHIGVAKDPDAIRTQKHIVQKRDITPAWSAWPKEKGVDAIALGKGWYGYEAFAGENFRWVGATAELLLTGGRSDGVANLALDLAPGPSLGSHPLQIEVFDDAGRPVFTSATITGRNTVVLPLRYRKQQSSLFTIKTDSDNLAIVGDPRILNYRVFSITLQ